MRHRRMLAPINTIKHYTHSSNAIVASGGLKTIVVAHSVVAPATSTAFDVKEGSVIKAVHLEYWVLGDEVAGTVSQFTFIVEKAPGNTAPMTAAQAVNLGAYPNKKNILFSSQGIVNSELAGGQSVPLIRAWVLIPKGKQRMGLDDQIIVHLAPVGAMRICGLATYKEHV